MEINKLKKKFVKKLSVFIVAILVLVPLFNVIAANGTDTYNKSYTAEVISNNYNLFIKGSVEGSAHVEGAVAIGGDVNKSPANLDKGFAFGNFGKAPSFIKGTLTTTAQYSPQAVGFSAVAYLGSSNFTSGVPNYSWIGTEIVENNSYIDFDKAFTDLAAQSATYAASPLAQAAVIESNKLTINVDTTDVINITAEQLNSLKSWGILDITGNFPTKKCVINVYGTTVDTNNIDLRYNGNQFATNEKDQNGMQLIWNFPEATSITLRDVAFAGHILAPKADIFMNSSNYSGCIMALSLTGAPEGHFYAFNAYTDPTIENDPVVAPITTTPPAIVITTPPAIDPTPADPSTPSTTPAEPTTPSTTPAEPSTPSTTPAEPSTPTTTPAEPSTPSTTPAEPTTPSTTPADPSTPTTTPADPSTPSTTPAEPTTPSTTPADPSTPTTTPADPSTPTETPRLVKVEGYITHEDGSPIADIVVQLENGLETATKSNGYYSFDSVEVGENTLTIIKDDGSIIAKLTISVSTPGNDTLNLIDSDGSSKILTNIGTNLIKVDAIIPSQVQEVKETKNNSPANEYDDVPKTGTSADRALNYFGMFSILALLSSVYFVKAKLEVKVIE